MKIKKYTGKDKKTHNALTFYPQTYQQLRINVYNCKASDVL